MKKIFKVFGVLVASIFIIAIFQLISPVLLVLCGYGIWYYMKKTPNPKRMKLAIVGTVISLFGTFALMTSGGENSASETTAKQSQTESSSTKAEDEQEILLKSASAAINVADIWPSRSNFTTASKAFDAVEPTDELQNKLKSVEEKVVREEENIKLAEEAIASAEANLTSESIENAKTYLAVVVTRQKDFTERIVNVERTIAEEESSRIAEEESARIAAEESTRIAAEESAAASNPSSGGSFSGNGDVTTNEPAQGDITVYWTPGGKSYHYNRNCSTLSRSTTILEGLASSCPKTDPCNICVN